MILAALTSACGKAGAEGDGVPASFAMPVEVAVAISDTIVEEILAIGEIEAVQSIELRPDIEGRIVEIFVREGIADFSTGTVRTRIGWVWRSSSARCGIWASVPLRSRRLLSK